MENQNNKKGLAALLVILIIILLALVGFIIYDKLINNTNNSNNTDIGNNSNSTPTSTYNYKLSKRNTIQAVSHGCIQILVDTEGNAYLYTIGNLDYEDDEKLKTNIQNVQNQFKAYSPKGYTYYDGSTELKACKLNMSGVLTAYYVHMGNGGSSYFVFVKENGELSYLSYDKLIYNGEISLKDISDLKNVVSVVENTYSKTPYAINLNGDEISLYGYIK